MRSENLSSINLDLRRIGIHVAEDPLLAISYEQQVARISVPVLGLAGDSLAGRLTLIFEQRTNEFHLTAFIITIFDTKWLSASPTGIIAISVFRNQKGIKYAQSIANVLQNATALQLQAATLARLLHPDVFPWTTPSFT